MTSQIRLGAIFWVLTAEFFLAQFIAQAAWPEYSMAMHDISVLGLVSCPPAGPMTCSPLNLLFNGGIILNGVLIVLGIWFTRTLWPAGALTTATLWLLVIGGGDSSMLVGLFPLDVSLPMHMIGATLALFVACFGIMLMGAIHWRTHRGFAAYSLATGAICLAAFVIYVMEIYLGLGRGTMERIAAWPHTVWYIVTGVLILRGYFRPSAS
jgi:hypothetical membrane protein